jgi:hypothetical protein
MKENGAFGGMVIARGNRNLQYHIVNLKPIWTPWD